MCGIMVVKKIPPPLHALCLQSLCQAMLQEWKNTYYTNYLGFSDHFINKMSVLIPPGIQQQVFDLMVDSHARFIQNEKTFVPSISALVNSIISPSLVKLKLNGLRHIGTVQDEEIEFLHSMLVCKLPYLDNLVEISLLTSGIDFTLPTCTDETLKEIGSSCFKLTTLDVSYNHKVTDEGLWFLIPSKKQKGCPSLTKVSLFECSVTHQGTVVLLEGLPKLRFLGYRETGISLWVLHKKTLSHTVQALELVHLNNLGRLSRTCKDFNKLECKATLVSAITNLCPKLNGLKVRVNDSTVRFLCEITTVSIIELVYNLGRPSSPGDNTIDFLQVCGAQFVKLSFVCDMFSSQCLNVICEQCNNLKILYIMSYKFDFDKDLTTSDKRMSVLSNLEEFLFKTGCDVGLPDTCQIPFSIFSFVLQKSSILTKVVLIMRNTLFSDFYIADLFSSIETSKIKKIEISVPRDNYVLLPQLSLTMVTVETLIGMCPELEELSKLLSWDISFEEIEGLRRQLQLSNSALVIV